MYMLYFYVPAASCEAVKESCFSAGAGTIGEYQRASWQALGSGQFLPSQNAQPAIGVPGQLERLEEFKVEMIVPSQAAKAVVQAMLLSHPYEEPAWGLVPVISSIDDIPEHDETIDEERWL